MISIVIVIVIFVMRYGLLFSIEFFILKMSMLCGGIETFKIHSSFVYYS